jgi:hypothetical protein
LASLNKNKNEYRYRYLNLSMYQTKTFEANTYQKDIDSLRQRNSKKKKLVFGLKLAKTIIKWMI